MYSDNDSSTAAARQMCNRVKLTLCLTFPDLRKGIYFQFVNKLMKFVHFAKRKQ